jgi:hypothetical protein
MMYRYVGFMYECEIGDGVEIGLEKKSIHMISIFVSISHM